jgi:hypothetical protein
MKTFEEFTLDYDEIDYLYYLVHRSCDSLELPINTELPAHTPDLAHCIELAKHHMKEMHSVDLDAFDPNDCPKSSEHFLYEHCDNCGYSTKG